MQDDRGWLYLLIYPGSGERLDSAVSRVVQPVVGWTVAGSDIKRWFFIRYVDERGPHIRLRFLTTPARLGQLRQELEQRLPSMLSQLAGDAVVPLPRLVPVNREEATAATPHFRFDTYEPEHDKYGGVQGVMIAEELFERSSLLVLDLFREQIPSLAMRGALAVALMRVVAEIGLPNPRDRETLWRRYFHYWSGGDGITGEGYRSTFHLSAVRRQSLLSCQIESLLQNASVGSSVEGYAAAVRRAFLQVAAARLRVAPQELCFHYVHMMNNRLGIFPLEESYLTAFVLSRSVPSPTGHP